MSADTKASGGQVGAAPPRWRALLLPAVMTVIGIVVLMGLGFWQLERLLWKSALVALIEARVHAVPGRIAPEPDWPRWTPAADEYRRVRLTGTFLNDKETLVHGNAPRDTRGNVVSGFFVLTPLRLADDAVVIVNRGFVPPEFAEPAKRPGSQPQGEVTITGLVRGSQERGWFVPKDNPAAGQWFSRDAKAIAAAARLERVAPFLIDADASPAFPWPKGGLTVVRFPNNHLEYALTWFGLAATLVGVFAVFVFRTLRPARVGLTTGKAGPSS
jgi:surfeit locus 1 family protein